MRRNVTAAIVQLTGIATAVTGAFMYAWQLGVIAVGLVVLLLGIDIEDDA